MLAVKDATYIDKIETGDLYQFSMDNAPPLGKLVRNRRQLRITIGCPFLTGPSYLSNFGWRTVQVTFKIGLCFFLAHHLTEIQL